MKSTVLEFIRFASNLKEIHIHRRLDFKITQRILLKIVNVLKSSRSQNFEPLKLFIDRRTNDEYLYDAIDNLKARDEPINLEPSQKLHIANYICISTKCNHHLNIIN